MRLSYTWMAALVAVLLAADLASVAAAEKEAKTPWEIPFFRARKKNPVPADAKSVATGKEHYVKQCLSCHGTTGIGDGPAAKDLTVNPGNLSLPRMWQDTDGALFWKMTEGRKPMQAFESLLTEEQRWNVVNYIRTLAPLPSAPAFEAPLNYRQAISGVLKPYFQVRTALAGGDFAAARDAAALVADAAGAVADLKGDDLDEKAKAAWAAAAPKLKAAVAPLGKAQDLAALRAAFSPFSEALVPLVEQFGHAELHPVFLFQCTEDSLKGVGRWLQDKADGRSPYSGRADGEGAKPSKVCGGTLNPVVR